VVSVLSGETKLILKCKECNHYCYHPAGSFRDVAEGGDDPYSYHYCSLGQWGGSQEEYGDMAACKDFSLKQENVNE
jgi:hypothetical protein